MQRRWAMAFVAPYLKDLKGDERILDIGCGEGKISADISKFVPRGSVLGIDPCKPMVDWAKKQYASLEYPNLSFQEGNFLSSGFLESFDLIFSNCALQYCLEPYRAFKNLAKLLKPNGKLIMTIPSKDNLSWEEARKNIESLPKWAFYWKQVTPKVVLTMEEYVEALEKVGLYPIRVEKIDTLDPFVDRQEFVDFLVATFAPVLPKELLQEFCCELINEYIRLFPAALQIEGVIEFRPGRIEIEAKKKS
jgi:SAM-dependent methyltransferase